MLQGDFVLESRLIEKDFTQDESEEEPKGPSPDIQGELLVSLV